VTVCVIDDDASVQRAMRRLLQTAGYAVRVFASGVEFLQAPECPRPMCLVVDVRMPGMTGLDLQLALTGTPHDVPMVMISGDADAATIDRALAGGAIAFLPKPVEADTLFEAVACGLAEDQRRMTLRTSRPQTTRS
jgi:two-component system response regulator FixJ